MERLATIVDGSNIYIAILFIYLLQSCCNNYVPYFSKLLKTHCFVMQIFRSHFGSFFCASSASSIYIHIFVCVYICIYIYILKRHYREIEKSILHKRMMAKKKIIYTDIYENLKSPYISRLNLLMS